MRYRVGLATLVAAALVAACGSRATFEAASFREIESAFQQAGIRVCERSEVADGVANQAVHSRTYEVALDCAGDGRADVTVDEFAATADRDAAVRGFEVAVRPRGGGAAWTYGRTSIFVLGTADDQVFDRVSEALAELGAQR